MPLTNDQLTKVREAQPNWRKFALLAEFALKELGSRDESTKKSGPEIIGKIKELYGDLDIRDSTYPVYLSQAPANNKRVVSLGTGRGYYLDESAEAEELGVQEPEEAEEAPVTERRQREAKLYPHIKNWLIANGYRAQVIAQGRSQGPWGNPDVVGIQITDILGCWHLQTVSVEVKYHGDNWKRDIFEAISHRRFYDRCYFCYPVLANNRQVPDEMKGYAELYSVGILLVELAPDDLRN